MKKIIFDFSFLCMSIALVIGIVSAENNYYELVYDNNFSMYAGTKTLKSIFSLTSDLSEKLFTIGDENLTNESSKLGKRIFKSILFDLPFTTFAVNFQHEYFGHGYLDRKLNLSIGCKYHYLLPYMEYDEIVVENEKQYKNLEKIQRISFSIKGVESTQFLAREMQKEFYTKEKVYYTNLFLYTMSKLDMSYRVFGIVSNRYSDIYDYVENIQIVLNGVLGTNFDKGKFYNDLKSGAVWNMIDPTLWLSMYYELEYFMYGKRYVEMPMIKLGEINFMPATRFNLTPIGYEYYFDVMFRADKTLLSIYFRRGKTSDYFCSGSGFGINNIIINKNIILGLNMDFWNQFGIKVKTTYSVRYYNTIRPHSSLGYRSPAPDTIFPDLFRRADLCLSLN